MKEQIRHFLEKALVFSGNILAIDVLICLGVALTFLLTGRFSFLAYSERLFWAGIAAVLLGGIVGFAVMFSGRSFGIPIMIRRPDEAKKLLDNFSGYREELEKRYDTSISIWLIGLSCIAISALVETLLV
jgi:hypothetical protein